MVALRTPNHQTTYYFNISRYIKGLQYMTHLYGLVGVHDDGDEQAEDDIDEKRNEGVEVDAGEPPHHRVFARSGGEGGKHVIPVDKGVEALHCRREGSELWEARKAVDHIYGYYASSTATAIITTVQCCKTTTTKQCIFLNRQIKYQLPLASFDSLMPLCVSFHA